MEEGLVVFWFFFNIIRVVKFILQRSHVLDRFVPISSLF